jgi:hypothetical protein
MTPANCAWLRRASEDDAAGGYQWIEYKVKDVLALLDLADERDRLREAAVKAREALGVFAYEETRIGENEEGEDYVQCDRCDGSAWGGDKEGCEHSDTCALSAIAALDQVLGEKP